jgi:hypothetical protein
MTMKNPKAIIVNYDYIRDVSTKTGIGTDLLFSEFDEAVDYVMETTWLQEEIDCMIENLLDDFVENYLPDFRQRVIEGRRENDAYEKFRAKQIDGEA